MELLIALIIIYKIGNFIYRLMKGRQEGEQDRRPPVPPAETPEENERDVSEEEKKFKKWLEDVFGPGHADGQESRETESAGWREDENYRENDDEDDDEAADDGLEDSEDKGYADSPIEDEIYGTGKIEPETHEQESPPEIAPTAAGSSAAAPAAPNSGQAAAFAGNPAAYGLIMAEILAKPKALRPQRQAFSRRSVL